ncbi:hypothetical protein B0H11DRAFT_1986304 [Mycena galericulata]|nr:hypothetical protein B0H11DRAFT_1986304 [Mycena galericulata]
MVCMTRDFESQGLSTSRISRLLRPLRTKCIALAAMHPTPRHPKHQASTYGKARSVEPSPLDLLPPPDSARSYHIDHRSLSSLRAAIYAVRNCFRDIVIKTEPVESVASTGRVARLADICSIIVGQAMQGEEDFGVEEDSEQLADMDNLYEFIPVQYRRSALLSHALDIILRSPHHFTLLSILLDVSLQHDLYHESCVLLHRLLEAAVSPGPGSCLPLCHPAHSDYLLDLSRKWKEAGRPTSILIRILTETLVEAARPELWSCKALGNLARELNRQDYESLMHMAGQLVASAANVLRHRRDEQPYGNAKRQRRALDERSLTDQLDKWMNYSPIRPPDPRDWPSRLDFLERCRQSGVHKNADSLAATVVCWATYYLSVATAPSADTHASVCRLLEDVSPTVKTYNLLVKMSFGVEHKLQDTMAFFQAYSTCLRAENLLLLDASLWACVLRFVETSMDAMGHCGTRKEVSLYREELMDLVEDAERLCFGNGVQGYPDATEPGWRWEEIPGCWVRSQSPAAKKAKYHHELRQPPLERRDPVLASGAATPCDSLYIVGTKADEHHCNRSHTSSFDLTFKSLVSSALSNRTTLNRSVSRESLPAAALHCSAKSALLPRHILPEEQENFNVPPSDDALDLFQYPGSSPVSYTY